MNPEEMAALVDLYIDGQLPDELHPLVETYLEANPASKNDVQSLRLTVAALHAAPPMRPDSWFTDRLLARLLQKTSSEEYFDSKETLT